MDHAYVFRRGVDAKPENRDLAMRVSVDAYVQQPGDQVHCLYEPCFQKLTPIRPINAQHHWRHPNDGQDVYCPYRVEGGGSGSTAWRPDWAALDDVLLRVRDRLAESGTECRIGTAAGIRSGLIGDWGAILPISRGNVEARAASFEIDGRRVIPIVALEDLGSLNEHRLARFLKQIVERQPVPVIRPKAEGPGGPWSLLTDPDQLGIDQVEDLLVGAIPIPINPREMFGPPAPGASFPWPPPGLLPIWVWTDHKEGLDEVKQGLEISLPLGVKVLRLLAKRLLVDGGSVHRALFAQSREEACDFFQVAERTFPRAEQIVQPAELAEIGHDTVLAALLKHNHLVHGCFLDLRTQSRHEEKERAGLTAVKTQLDETLARVTQGRERHEKEREQLIAERERLKQDGDEGRRELSRLQDEVRRLQKSVEEARSESYLRLRKLESATRELAQARRRIGWVLAVAVTVMLALAVRACSLE